VTSFLKTLISYTTITTINEFKPYRRILNPPLKALQALKPLLHDYKSRNTEIMLCVYAFNEVIKQSNISYL